MSASDFLAFVQGNVFLFAALVGLGLAIASYEFRQLTRKYRVIDPAALVTLLNKKDVVLLDVREDSELGERRIRGAKHLPASLFDKRVGELEKSRRQPHIAYCASGLRSHAACRTLTRKGFLEVYNLKGGLAEWERAGMPTVKK